MESANFFANIPSVTPSSGFAECWLEAICSSTGGGKYAWLFSPNCGSSGGALGAAVLGEVSDVVDDEKDEDSDQSVDDPGSEVGDCGGDAGGFGRSTPSRSPSRMMSLSSSIEGKKFRKSASACHLDAFLNSTQTSMRPGRDSAGSSLSRWLVVLYIE